MSETQQLRRQVPLWERLSFQLFVSTLTLVVLCSGIVGAAVVAQGERWLLERSYRQLEQLISIVSESQELEVVDSQVRLEPLSQLGEVTDVRLSLFAASGQLVYDSDFTLDDFPTNAERVEVEQALRDGVGRARRKSRATEEMELFVARRWRSLDGQLFVLRGALPQRTLAQELAEWRWSILWVVLLTTVLGVTVILFSVRRITHPVAALTAFGLEIGKGNFEAPVARRGVGELAQLAAALEQIRRNLRDRLRAESEEKKLLRTILDAMSEGVLVVDSERDVLLSNPRAVELLRQPGEKMTEFGERRSLIELTRNPQLHGVVDTVFRTRETVSDEVRSLHGSQRFVLVSAAPILVKSRVRGVVVAMRDMTEVRQLERMRRDFVANVSHELRTPIAAISGWSETLTSGVVELPEFVEQQLLTIHRHAERLANLVNDLLALAKVESLGLDEGYENFSLSEILGEVLDGLEDLIETKDIQVDITVSPEAEHVRSSARAVSYMVRNLIENAVKYTDDDGEIGVRCWVDDDEALRVEVEDDGRGIDTKHLGRIFERFYRVDKGRSRDSGGTGLGLSIVKHFAEALGGYVSVESRLGVGSKFTIVLPRLAWGPMRSEEDA